MSRYSSRANFEHGSREKAAVLLVNLGTPNAPTSSAVRKYLREFLSDPRVVEIPRLLWMLILYLIILPLRSSRSAANYERVWEKEGSPLKFISERQAVALNENLKNRDANAPVVKLAMRYGEPAVSRVLQELRDDGVQKLFVLPAYPQYSGATTASVIDAVTEELRGWRRVPEVRWATQYHDHTGYIDALAASVTEHWSANPRSEKLLISFHGTPKRTLLLGDPYHCHCLKTARLLAEKLGLNNDEYGVSFQSRFGKAEWLQPYTAATLEAWAESGLSSVDVICPGFSADCLETLDEIAREATEEFVAAGGTSLSYIPALNDRNDHIDLLADIVMDHTQGWLKNPVDESTLSASKARALAAGAAE